MAYIISSVKTAEQTSGTTYAVTFPSGVLALDLLLVKLSQDGSTASFGVASSGFTALGTQTISNASSSQWFFKIAAGGETAATFACASDNIIATTLLIRDAHATAPFGASPTSAVNFIRTDWTGVGSSACGTLTPPEDECLLIYSWNADGSSPYLRCKINELTAVDKYTTLTTSSANHIIGYRQQQVAASTAGSVTVYSDITTGGNGWVLAIRNKSGGALQPDIRPDVNELKWYGTWNEEYDGSTSWATNAPSTFYTGITEIGGIAVSATAPTVANNAASLATKIWNPSITTIASAENTTAWVGGWHTISSTDLTNKIVGFMWETSQSGSASLQGGDGILIGFSDGTNAVFYKVITKSFGWLAGVSTWSFVAPGNGTPYDSNGTVATVVGACTRIGFFNHRVTGGTTSRTLGLRDLAVFGTTALTGGGSSRPATFNDYRQAITSWGQWGYATTTSSAQVQAIASMQIGDGTNKTYFDGAAQSFEFPQIWSQTTVDNWQMFWNAASNAVSLVVKAKSGDTINLASGVAATDTAQNLSVSASSAATGDATYSFAQSFVGWRDPIDNKGLTWNGATFKECGTVTIAGGGDLTNCTIAKTTSTHAPLTITANGTVVTTSTITVADTSITTAHHISLDASVTSCTLNGVTLSGAAGTDKIYSALASGTLTITVDGTGTALAASDVTFVGGSSASAVIAAPALYQEAIASGFTAGSRIQIYDTTNSIELFNGTASAGDTVVSGSTATWTDPTAAAGNRAIRVRVAYVNGTSAEQWQELTGLTCGTTSGTESVTYPITPIDDDTYNDNAIDGPAIYATSGITFTDAATDLVNISIAGGAVTWQTIYACFVYWLFTAAGIDDDVAYIDAPDPANYLLTSMKLKNTHANPLTVTGGYGRSATTGLVADIIDTAGSTGNIFPSPDHVVAYATGSGALTAGDITNIWAAATRTITTTIPAAADNAAAVAAVAVDGATTLAESLRLANAVLGGKVSGASTGTESFRDIADTKNRVVATVDSSGNRTAITRDLT